MKASFDDIPAERLNRSSMMAIAGELEVGQIDQILNHLVFLPFVGIKAQRLMDDFGCPRGSSNLTALVQTKMSRLKDELTSSFKTNSIHRCREKYPKCAEVTQIATILRHRLKLLKSLRDNSGYELIYELLSRLVDRVTAVFPYDIEPSKYTYFPETSLSPEVMDKTQVQKLRQSEKIAEIQSKSSKAQAEVRQGYGKGKSKTPPKGKGKGKRGKGKGRGRGGFNRDRSESTRTK